MKQKRHFQGGFKTSNSSDLVYKTLFFTFALMSNVNILPSM